MNVLLSGGSGFLGRHIVQAAQAKGLTVFAPRSGEFNLETNEGIGDFMSELIRQAGHVDVFIHSAAYYGGIGIIGAEPATILEKNCRMGINAFEAARKFGIPKLLPVGSACAYPGYLDGDLREDAFWAGPLHESVEPYGFTKKLLQVAQRAYYRQHGIESNHLILTNLYGPHDVFTEYRSHVVAALIKKFSDADDEVVLWGDGSPIREFLYVQDAADAIVAAISLEHELQPINIGTGIGTSIRELAEHVARFIGFTGRIRWDTSKPNGAARKVLDVSRMRNVLNWRPSFELEKGLRQTVDWYLENKHLADQRT